MAAINKWESNTEKLKWLRVQLTAKALMTFCTLQKECETTMVVYKSSKNSVLTLIKRKN